MLPRHVIGLVVAVALGAATAGAQSARGTVDGVVTDTSLAPLGAATVSIVGSTVRVVTGANGRFRIGELPRGEYVLVVRRVGYAPASVQLTMAGPDSLHVSVSLPRAATALDTVTIHERQAPKRFDEFDERHRLKLATASFTRDDILKVNPVDTWQMLRRVSAMKLQASGKTGAMLPVSNRGMRITKDGAVPCFMLVMIDGVMMGGEKDALFDLRSLPPPDEIHGIEVFAGGASIPVQYGGSTGGAATSSTLATAGKDCGLIAIWTR